MARDVHAAIDAVWRLESARIIGALARRVRDVGLAEELAQDALVAALEHWPKDGIPDNPGAWLMTTAKNRALDRIRQFALHREKQQVLGADADARGDHVVPDFSDSLDDADDIGDDLLRLVFTACHARARTPEATDWNRIVALYGELMTCTPSPVVELNRAVAVSMAEGPAAALLLVDGLVTDGHLARYHLLHAARGDFLARLDRHDEARAEFERAASMTANEREKALLLERARGAPAR